MEVTEKIKALLDRLRQGLYEKEEAVRLALLSALAGESIFLLGPPGVAKSLIARKLKFAFRDGKSFEYLMNKFSTPDEVFGPVSIKKLKEEDKYERLTDRYLPGANIVFLDEIWKAGPSIQNALLTVLNEKVYRNGEQEVAVDIKGIIAASNELPAVGEGLDALWDRFLVRSVIEEIRTSGNFVGMITDTTDLYEDTIPAEHKISNDDMSNWQRGIEAVAVPPEVVNTIQLVKYKIEQHDAAETTRHPFAIYDRRWKKIVRLLRTSAFLNERTQVDLMDCFLMVDCLWNHPTQLDTVREIVAEVVRKHGYTLALNLGPLKQEIRDLEEEVKSETRVPYTQLVDQLEVVDREYYQVLNMEQYFDGHRVKAKEFDRLGVDEFRTVSLYDAQNNLTNRVKARRSTDHGALVVNYQSKDYTFQLKSGKREKTELIYKKAHPLLESYWQERIDKLKTYVGEQQQKVRTDAPAQLTTLRNNLFVDANLAELVEANMKDVSDALERLLLQLDKIKFSYEQLGEQ